MNGNLAYKEEPRTELINGEVVAMTPGPAWGHVSIAGNIYGIFRDYLKGKKCTPIMDGFDVHLSEKDVFQPDMMVVCDREKIKRDGVHGAPDLVVEVLSPSTADRDRGYKKDLYGKCGVREYWIVTVADQSVEVYLSNGSELVFDHVYTVHPNWMLAKMSEVERAAVVTRFKCSLFDNLEISLDDIFSDFFL